MGQAVGLQVGYSLRGLKESDTTEHTHSSETVKISGCRTPALRATIARTWRGCRGLEACSTALGKPLLMLRRNSHPGSQEEQLQGLEVTRACGPQPPGPPHLIHRQMKSQQVAPTRQEHQEWSVGGLQNGDHAQGIVWG